MDRQESEVTQQNPYFDHASDMFAQLVNALQGVELEAGVVLRLERLDAEQMEAIAAQAGNMKDVILAGAESVGMAISVLGNSDDIDSKHIANMGWLQSLVMEIGRSCGTINTSANAYIRDPQGAGWTLPPSRDYAVDDTHLHRNN